MAIERRGRAGVTSGVTCPVVEIASGGTRPSRSEDISALARDRAARVHRDTRHSRSEEPARDRQRGPPILWLRSGGEAIAVWGDSRATRVGGGRSVPSPLGTVPHTS